MNKKTFRLKLRRRTPRIPAVIRAVVLAAIVAVGGFGIAQQVSAETSSDYCDRYSSNAQQNACLDGIRGADCGDYAIIVDEATANICRQAAKAKADGVITDTPEFKDICDDFTGELRQACNGGKTNKKCNLNTASVDLELYNACAWGAGLEQLTEPPRNDSNNGSGSNTDGGSGNDLFDFFKLQDQLDQAQDLTEYIDVLHKAGQDANIDTSKTPDDSYGFYINGAGKKQKIQPYPNPGTNSPAILFINGGGWHANDHVSDRVVGTGQLAARGYAAFDLTYRLGSSGVYYMFEDVLRGIRHVINNADMYGVDPSKIVIWGDSAGGSLSMRAAASGKSGAKAAVGWSAPTNAYTALFKSYKTFLIGLDHSTCIPTDLAGMTNFTDLLTGGSGEVAQYGQGLSSNDFTNLGIVQDQNGFHFDQDSIGGAGALGTVTQVLTAAQYAYQTSQNIETISRQIQDGGVMSMSGGLLNLSSKKLIECIDNLNVLSPALFASPETPPSFLAGFTTDDLIDPSQLEGMKEKLQSLGIRSDTMIIPGDTSQPNAPFGAWQGNHLDFDERFVCPTLNFIDSIVQPERGNTDCKTGIADNPGGANVGGGGLPTGSSGSSGGSSGGTNNKPGFSGSGSDNSGDSKACVSPGHVGGSAGCEIGSSNNSGKACSTWWDSNCGGASQSSSQNTGDCKSWNWECNNPGQPKPTCQAGYNYHIGTGCVRVVKTY